MREAGDQPTLNTTETPSPASATAFALLASFAALGVRDVVVCPGSRSQALALAAAALATEDAFRLHVRLDERGAAFLALGLAVETGAPALVVTTSGTAVANLHPAVLEAHHAGVPLIVLSADRPEELRGIRSNQTTVQPGIFGPVVRLLVDAAPPVGDAGETDAAAALATRTFTAATDAADPGPVHLNLQLREPLSSGSSAVPVRRPPAEVATELETPSELVTSPESDALPISAGPLTVVIAGADAGEEAEAVARAGGWPLIAEVSSGAHFGPNLVVAYRQLLGDADFGGRVERAVVFGHPTLSREVPALIQRPGVETIVVGGGAEHYDPGHAVRTFARRVRVDDHEPTPEERRWTGRWVATSRRLLDADESGAAGDAAPRTSGVALGGHVEDFAAQREYVKAEMAAVRAPVTRRMLAEAVWNATWPHDRLVFGASRLIRDADRAVGGRRIRVHSNRGLAGIDGTVATALGIALASQAGGGPGITRALIGDLTLLHDAGSLLIGAGEQRPRILIVVGNDGGGTIFDTLEVAGSAPAADFDRVLYTPQSADLAALAAAYGWEYRTAATHGRLGEALTLPVTGPTILEVPLPR